MPNNNLVPIEALAELKGWDQLPAPEQKEVKRETEALSHSLMDVGFSRLAVGEHLFNLQAILEPKRMFSKFLKIHRLNRSTAYKHIVSYKNAKATLPEAVLRVAMARGFKMLGEDETRPLGVYTEAVKQLPPPKTEDTAKIETWLGQVEQKRKAIRPKNGHAEVVVESPENLQKECYRFFETRFRRLPVNHKTRAKWVEGLIGMMLTKLGVSGPKNFVPMGIPEGFQAVRGRPPLELAA